MSLAMTREERQAFLADLHVGVLSVEEGEGRAPLATPVWYSYEPGGLVSFVIGVDARKTVLLRQAGRASLCVQSEEPPYYKYVTVEGPLVAMDSPPNPGERRALAHRYLGEELGDRYIQSTAAAEASMVTVRIQPEHWLSTDFAKTGRRA